MPIYTRTGDSGSTSLFGGKRVLKCNELVEAYGSLDELNSLIGGVASQMHEGEGRSFLMVIQSDLFVIGSTLAGWRDGDLDPIEKRVSQMEARIDALDKELPRLTNFILPGGTPLASQTHVTRSVCRRVERQTVALAQKQEVDGRIIKYLNRLSDLLFTEARFINKEAGVEETVWSGIKRERQR